MLPGAAEPTVCATCIGEAGHGGQAGRLSQDQADPLGVGFALVVGLGHDGGGEEHVTQGAALVPVHLCLCAVLEETRGVGGDTRRGQKEKERGRLTLERGTLCNEPSPCFLSLSLLQLLKYSCISLGSVCGCAL